MMIKGISSTLIWLWNNDQRDLLYFDLEWECRSKGSPLLRSGMEMLIKGISSTLILLWNDDQRDLLYFDNLELK